MFSKGSKHYASSVYAMNGKSVEVENPDAEGRLALAGGLPVRIFGIDLS
jgi:leucyl aminopeptidase